jgi:hypothetical protein
VRLYNPWGWDNTGATPLDALDDGVIDVSWTLFKSHFIAYAWTSR